MGVTVTKELVWDSANSRYELDMAEWDYAVIQIIQQAGYNIEFKSTNDGGAVTGSVDDSGLTALNSYSILAQDLSDGTFVSSTTTLLGLYKITDFGRYILLNTSQKPKATIIKAMLYKFG